MDSSEEKKRTRNPPSESYSDGYASQSSLESCEEKTATGPHSSNSKRESSFTNLVHIKLDHLPYGKKAVHQCDFRKIIAFLDKTICQLPNGDIIVLNELEKDSVTAKQIQIDNSIFGQNTKNLLPAQPLSEKITELVNREKIAKIHKAIGVDVDSDGDIANDAIIGNHVERAEFGCKSFPAKLIGGTLKNWKKNPENLKFIAVSWKEILTDRRESVLKMNMEHLNGRMEHIWRRSQHHSSIFAKADIKVYDVKLKKLKFKNTDQVDMYVLYSDDDKHMAVLSISDVALTVHCGFRHGKGVVPILKQAFANVTAIRNDYYEVIEPLIP